jgi:hypothetical protein
MGIFTHLLALILFVSCTSDEDRLSYGITKHKAELQLTKSAKEFKENPKACIARLSPEEVRDIEIKRKGREYIIASLKEQKIQRIEIKHKSPNSNLGFKWESENYPSKFARLVLESETSCFFLEDLDIKQLGKIKLFLNPKTHITDVSASFSKFDTLKDCDYSSKISELQKAYKQSKEAFTDQTKFLAFVKALLPSLKRGGCKRKFDRQSVPMWWLCGHMEDANCTENDPVMWFRYLKDQSQRFPIALKVLNSSTFKDSLDEKTASEID